MVSVEMKKQAFRLGVIFSIFLFVSSAQAVEGPPTVENQSSSVQPMSVSGESGAGSGTALPDLFTGSLSYSIPIEIPPGPKGFQPSLSLFYRSNNGNGWVGVGWELEVGSISRSTKGGVNFSGRDYVFQSSAGVFDLIQIAPYEYRAKIEKDYLRFKILSDSYGYPYWEVTDKSGTKYIFGNDSVSRQADPADDLNIYKWCLRQVRDTHNNWHVYNYSKDQGQLYLASIFYPNVSILFLREGRTDVSSSYTAGFSVTTAYRLKSFEIKANNELIRKYELNYDSDPSTSGEDYSRGTGRSLLGSVTKVGSDGTTTLPATVFGWQAGGDAFEDRGALASGVYGQYDQWPGHIRPMDVTGDGLSDLVLGPDVNGGWFVLQSTGTGFVNKGWWLSNAYANWTGHLDRIRPMDVNGDGKQDMVIGPDGSGSWYVLLSSGTAFVDKGAWITGAYGNWDGAGNRIRAMDVNGDGMDDIVIGPDGGGNWYVLQSTGTGFVDKGAWITGAYGHYDQWPGHIRSVDVTGDGLQDIVLGPDRYGNWFVMQSTGTRFVDKGCWLWNTYANWTGELSRIRSMDVNGDGRYDFVLGPDGGGNWYVLLSTGKSFVNKGAWITGAYGNWSGAADRIRPMDVNGDGLHDIVLGPDGGGSWYVLRSTGTRFENRGTYITGTYGNWDGAGNRIRPMDINGDGMHDLVIGPDAGGNWYVLQSGGSRSDLLSSVENGLGGRTDFAYESSVKYANTRLPFPVQVVSSVTRDDGNGVVSTTRYAYAYGYYHAPEKEFRGFNYAKETGPVSESGLQQIKEMWFHQGNDTSLGNTPSVATGYMKGKPYASRIYDSQGKTYAREYYYYFEDLEPLAPYFNPLSRHLKYVYDGDGTAGLITDIRYEYDSYGNVVLEKNYGNTRTTGDELTIERAFAYNSSAWIVNLPLRESVYKGIGTAEKVSEATYYYDGVNDCSAPSGNQMPDKGNLTRTVKWLVNPESVVNPDPSDPEIWMGYDARGSVTCVRDASGNFSHIAYDPSGVFPLSTTNAKGHQTTVEYYGVNGVPADKGTYGQEKKATDPNGATRTKEYDPLGRVVREYEPAHANSLFGTVSYFYEDFGSVGQQRVLAYYAEQADSAVSCPSGYVFNAQLMRCEKAPYCPSGYSYDSTQNICVKTTTSSYSATRVYNQCTAKMDSTTCSASPGGNCTFPGSYNVYTAFFDSSCTWTYLRYNPTGQMYFYNIKVGQTYSTLANVTSGWTYTCSSGGTLNGTTCTKTTTYTSTPYCYSGTLNGTEDICTSSPSIGNYAWKEEYFDGWGRKIKTRSEGPDGKYVLQDTYYGSTGTVLKKALPYFAGRTASFVSSRYDAMGRVVEIEKPGAVRAQVCYNDDVVVAVDENGHRKRETRDAFGRLVKVQEYQGVFSSCTTEEGTPYATTSYTYDVLGNLQFVTDAQGNRTEMRYDSLGRKVFMQDPDMGEWRYDYDPNGNLTYQRDAKGQEIRFTYDSLNRLTLKDYPTGTDARFLYDESSTSGYALGQLTTMADASGTTRYHYDDPYGRKTRKVQTVDGVAYSISRETDILGRIRSITYPDGETVPYTYDGAGNLLQAGGYVTYSGHYASGQPHYADFPNGIHTSLYYDVQSRISGIYTTKPGMSWYLQNEQYAYDAKQNIKSIQVWSGVSGSTPILDTDRTQYFGYDSLDRITSASSGFYGNLSYGYDRIGNFSSKEGVAHYPDISRPHAVGSTTDGMVFRYDANGNMESDGLRNIAWDYDNRPSSISYGGATTQFVYDGAGNRVKKVGPAGTSLYIDKLYECSGGVCSKYIFADGKRIALKSDTQTLYYHPNHLGSSVLVTDAAGAVYDEIFYKPFGEEVSVGADGNVSHRFTGQEYDWETDFYYYNARYYNPRLGKFISADILVPDPANPQSLNRYSYCVNNPVLYIDPSGNIFGLDDILIGAVIGAIIGGTAAEVQGGDFWDGALTGAIGGAFFGGAGFVIETIGASTAGQIGIHAIAGGASGGITSYISGGDVGLGMLTGAIAGGVGNFAGTFLPGDMRSFQGFAANFAGRSLAGGISGGIAAELYGGSFGSGFLSGAQTGAIGFMANHWAHEMMRAFKTAAVEGSKATRVALTKGGQAVGEIGRNGPPLARFGLGLGAVTTLGPFAFEGAALAGGYVMTELLVVPGAMVDFAYGFADPGPPPMTPMGAIGFGVNQMLEDMGLYEAWNK